MIKLSCKGHGTCRGTLSLRIRVKRHIRRQGRTVTVFRTVKLAHAKYSVRSGHSKTVTLDLTSGGASGSQARPTITCARATATVRGGERARRTITLLG